MAEEKNQITSDTPTKNTAKPKRTKKRASGNEPQPIERNIVPPEADTAEERTEDKACQSTTEACEKPQPSALPEQPAAMTADSQVTYDGVTAEKTEENAVSAMTDTNEPASIPTENCDTATESKENLHSADSLNNTDAPLNESIDNEISSEHSKVEAAEVTEITDREPLFPTNDENKTDSSAPANLESDELRDMQITEPSAADSGLSAEDTASYTLKEDKPDKSAHPTKKNKEKGKNSIGAVRAVFDFVELFVFTLVAVLIITTFFVRQSVVEGNSMLGTLHDGDNLLISDFLYEPKPGDIVVCEDYSTKLKKPIIKRVIATSGQTVRITPHAVIVNGRTLDEPYVYTDVLGYKYDVSIPHAVFRENAEEYSLKYEPGYYYEIVVPEGEIFVLGDHRNDSTDSRILGTIDTDTVLGRVLIRFYPFDKFGTVN